MYVWKLRNVGNGKSCKMHTASLAAGASVVFDDGCLDMLCGAAVPRLLGLHCEIGAELCIGNHT